MAIYPRQKIVGTGDLREATGLLLEVLEFLPGDPVVASAGVTQREESVGVTDGERVQHICVEQREERGVEAQGHGDGGDYRRGEPRRAKESADCISRVLSCGLDPGKAAAVATLFLHPFQAAK